MYYTDKSRLKKIHLLLITTTILLVLLKIFVEKNIAGKPMYHFYLNNFVAKDFPQVIKWNQVNATRNTCTGYFTDSEGAVVQVEQSNNTKFLALNSLIKMNPPTGYHFMKNGSLMSGSDISHPGATDNKWTSIWTN